MAVTAIIEAQRLGKAYTIAKAAGPYRTLREDIVAFLRGKGRGPRKEVVWALRDVSFALKEGDILGVIGRNGAGKSTLLKIISRITDQTEGSIVVRGRVGSLLEVGTGFHPELTGRENVFLNGALLGMRRSEIRRRFDQIVSFAAVERFIDTPVKRYSSGMYMRLAFAVAAHLETEILLVDEVLAVGDLDFQTKCLDRMREVTRQGRTIVFVSHNLSAITQLCSRAILLEGGRLAYDGEPTDVVGHYLSKTRDAHAELIFDPDPSKSVQIARIQILDARGTPTSEVDAHGHFAVAIEVIARQPAIGTVSVRLETLEGVRVCRSVCGDQTGQYTTFRPNQRLRYVAQFPGAVLAEGGYLFSIWVLPGPIGVLDHQLSAPFYLRSLERSSSLLGDRKPQRTILAVPLAWQVNEI